MLDLLRTLYEVLGGNYPRASTAIAALIGAVLFGGGWWLIGRGVEAKRSVEPTQQKPTSQLSVQAKVPPASRSGDGDLGMTLEELDKKYRSLDGRFAEQEALVRESNGKKIRWDVEVLSVGNCQPHICLTFLCLSHSQLWVTTARFGEDFRQRLYALHRGDRITLEGVLAADIYGGHLNVDATGFQLLPSP